MSRVLLVFHSRTGTARKVAIALESENDWALGEVETRRPGAGFLRCGAQALLHLHPAIDYDGPDPAAFDLVVLVSPVWCGNLAAPMRSFLAKYGSELRSHAVFMVMGGDDAQGAITAIDRLLGRPARVTTALRQADVDTARQQPAIEDFARRVRAQFEPAEAQPARKAA
jgi:flavodoxin